MGVQVPKLQLEDDVFPPPPDWKPRRPPSQTVTFHDKYVIEFDFSKIDEDQALKELKELLDNLEGIGLHTELRAGHDQSILVFVKAPRELLGHAVYKSRVKDWLYGVSSEQPQVGGKHKIVDGAFEAEDLLSMYHLVHWDKNLGGAGITPGTGKWENVKSIFPLHNEKVNQELLVHLSKHVLLRNDDLDKIRNLFGPKVAMYFAFLQTYIAFLFFPAIAGFFAWLFLPKYSLGYALVIELWCIVFLEYWKLQEVDLGIRWNVKGVGTLKVNRPGFKPDKVTKDEHGMVQHHYSRWKQVMWQTPQIPFFVGALVCLGGIIAVVFALEILISEAYEGPYKYYLEYLPTVILAVALPYASSFLEEATTVLTDWENHRTSDTYEMSKTQKLFVLNFIVSYTPIFLTAFVYVPFGDAIVPYLKTWIHRFVPSKHMTSSFHSDPDKLRNEVIALTVTGQISSAGEELILPYIMHKLRSWYREWRSARLNRAKTIDFKTLMADDPAEEEFLRSARNEASLEEYNVQDDYLEMVLQFGHLALFSPVWPLVPIGFLVNNWFELRSDFIKICHGSQRPAPVRADSIGPWIASLEFLTWLGSISTAAVVHMFGGPTIGLGILPGGGEWWALPMTVFISEHVYLLVRTTVRSLLDRIGSEQTRKLRQERYVMRKRVLDELEASNNAAAGLDVKERERRKSVLVTGADVFWTKQVEDGVSFTVGRELIQALKNDERECSSPARGRKED